MSLDAADREFAALCSAAQDTLGLHLESYRGRQLERRLGFFRQRHGLASNADLARRLRSDEELRQKFADFLTINVTEFFRNPERFQTLRERYLPALLKQRLSLRVWSAGCSIGAEIYSVAMLLLEMAPEAKHELLATDIDAGSLARARKAIYKPQEVRETPVNMRRRYFQEMDDQRLALSPQVRNMVRFQHHDLLRDSFPENMDLILCRNVVIYFTQETKAALYRRLYDSLRPGGILFIGATESVFEARQIGLKYREPCFYEKPLQAIARS